MKTSYRSYIRKFFGMTTNLERDMAQGYIENFASGMDNHLDFHTDRLISELKARFYESEEKLERTWKEEQNPKKNDAERLNLASSRWVQQQDVSILKDELLAIIEMKIIYVYKLFEINVKTLLVNAYDNNIKDIFKWERLKYFLKSKGIEIAKLNGYSEVNELRLANNLFKHSGTYADSSVQNILEFKDKEKLSFNDIDLFYNSVKNYPQILVDAISKSIYNDIYKFDEAKLSKMAFSLALRMDKTNAIKLSEKLLKHYE